MAEKVNRCRACGAVVPDGMTVCPVCGERIEVDRQPDMAPETAPQMDFGDFARLLNSLDMGGTGAIAPPPPVVKETIGGNAGSQMATEAGPQTDAGYEEPEYEEPVQEYGYEEEFPGMDVPEEPVVSEVHMEPDFGFDMGAPILEPDNEMSDAAQEPEPLPQMDVQPAGPPSGSMPVYAGGTGEQEAAGPTPPGASAVAVPQEKEEVVMPAEPDIAPPRDAQQVEMYSPPLPDTDSVADDEGEPKVEPVAHEPFTQRPLGDPFHATAGFEENGTGNSFTDETTPDTPFVSSGNTGPSYEEPEMGGWNNMTSTPQPHEEGEILADPSQDAPQAAAEETTVPEKKGSKKDKASKKPKKEKSKLSLFGRKRDKGKKKEKQPSAGTKSEKDILDAAKGEGYYDSVYGSGIEDDEYMRIPASRTEKLWNAFLGVSAVAFFVLTIGYFI